MEMKPMFENASEKKVDRSPFEGLEISEIIKGANSQFYDIPGHPELILRQSYIRITPSGDKEHPYRKDIEFWTGRAHEFKKLGEQHGVRIAKTQYVFGVDPVLNEPALFAITERIEGKNMDDIHVLDERAAKDMDEMYAGMLWSLKETYLARGAVWRDLKDGQIVYGTAPGETEPHPYIVDVDPVVDDWMDEESGRKDKKTTEKYFLGKLAQIMNMMEYSEEKTGHLQVPFTKTRGAYNEIVHELGMKGSEDNFHSLG